MVEMTGVETMTSQKAGGRSMVQRDGRFEMARLL